MHTRPLTERRFSELEQLTPIRGEIDEAYLDTHRTITRWLVIGDLQAPRELIRVAYDPEGPDGIFGDEHQVARVHFAPESGCWRWQVHCVRGHRSGLSKSDDDAKSFPFMALALACGHLDLAMAHERFMLGTISEESREEPVVQTLSHPKLPLKLLPWNRYFSKASRRSHECYYRCWAKVRAEEVPSKFGFRPGPRSRAVELVHRLGSKQGATVIHKPIKGKMTWCWHVFDGESELDGTARNRNDAFKRAGAGLKKLGIQHSHVCPTIAELAARMQLKEVLP